MIARSSRRSLRGSITVPGSKSHTVRAAIFGMLADGTTIAHGPAASGDGLAALNAARALGARIDIDEAANIWTIEGTNGRPHVPSDVIDTMNSGTTTSFTIGACSLLEDGWGIVTGDEQIRSRPWRHETDALAELGAVCIHTRPNCDCPPIVVRGPLRGGVCHLHGMNSQHVSGILVPSALLPHGASTEILVEDPHETPYIQITLDWMARFGVEVETSPDFTRFVVRGGQRYRACECFVPADWSAVAFPLVAAVCTESEIAIDDVDFEDSQGDKAVVDILREMGADVRRAGERRLEIRGGRPLRGRVIDIDLIPDSLPALAVAAAYAEGDTTFTNAEHVRIKETDRIAVMKECIEACGGEVDITESTMTVHGGRPLHGAEIDSRGDHRIAMAMAACGLAADGEMRVSRAECADVSFPGFYRAMNSLGAGIDLL